MKQCRHSLTILLSFALALAVVAATLSGCSSASPSSSTPTKSGSSESPKASSQAANKEPYTVGITGALTGPAAPSYLPNAEGMRIFFEDLNAHGGIDGHPVQASFEDDHADPKTATTNIQKFTSQSVTVLVNATASSTYAPTVAEAKRANVPIFMVGVAPPDVLPPTPDPLVFAISQLASVTGAPLSSLFSASTLAKGAPIKMAYVTVDIPVAVAITNRAIELSKQFNATVTMIKVPQGLADFTPVASQIIDEGDNWATAIGPAIGVSTYAALDKMGFKGNFLDLTAFEPADLGKLQKDNLYLSSPIGPFNESNPYHKKVLDASKTYGATINSTNLIAGWAQAETIAEVLKRTGWPATTDKLLKTMANFEMTHGNAYPPTKWTPTDHNGSFIWSVFHWDKDKKAILPMFEWYSMNSAGDPKSVTKVGTKMP